VVFSFQASFLVVLAVFLHQGWANPVEQFFKFATVLKGLPQDWHQFKGHIETVSAAPLRKGQQPSRVLIPPRTGGAVFADAGLIDLVQGTFEGGPQRRELRLPFMN
jgi:hypothetical protein